MTTDIHASEPHTGEDLSADEYGEGHHGATDKQYIVIALILAVMTALEVTLSYVDVGALFLPALLILMVAKFITVVSYFMHLKFDNKLFSFLFYLGLILAVFVYAVALSTFHFFGS
ncbi:MAG: cytochrome C oxidase subunit IV family protein [Ilumatobacteraceae bacterium]